jgi:hypothetical protein
MSEETTERAKFEAAWLERKRRTWAQQLGAEEPPEGWSEGFRGSFREGWDAARAALSPPPDDQMAVDARRLDWLERQVRASSYKLLFGMHKDPAIQAGVNRFRVTTGIGSGALGARARIA